MIEWILLNRQHLSDLLHYRDDFITSVPPNSGQCARNLQTALSVCRTLGLPFHPNKWIGPSSRLVVLSIELDSSEQCARLLDDKLVALRELINSWHSRRWCTWYQLELLIGHLHHAPKWCGSAALFFAE